MDIGKTVRVVTNVPIEFPETMPLPDTWKVAPKKDEPIPVEVTPEPVEVER